MIAELAAFTAAAKTVSAAIQAGRNLTTVASSIGKMAESKDQLHTRLQKKKASPFQNDYEEFMALEEIREREEDLLKMMVYTGRIGLKDDFIKFQAEARRQRKEAIREAERQREARVEMITTGVLILMSVGSIIGLFVYLYINYG
jgi:molecular chaperone GrpE (heat shock protein)